MPAIEPIRQKGQVLIIFLLIIVIGLALVLSVASRTFTDIRISTTGDESNRAYFAAEAGIEQALRKLEKGGFSGGSTIDIDFKTLNQSAATTTLENVGGGIEYLYPVSYGKDEVAQIMLVSDTDNNGVIDDSDLSAGAWAGTSLNLNWGFNGNNPAPAILVTGLFRDAVGQFTVSKVLFDPVSGRTPGSVCVPSGGETVSGVSFAYKATINLSSSEGCPSNGNANLNKGANKPVLLRVRFLYNSAKSQLGLTSSTPLPPQAVKIESIGYTSSGVSRRLEVTRLFPSVPAFFDYVLFSGSDIKKPPP